MSVRDNVIVAVITTAGAIGGAGITNLDTIAQLVTGTETVTAEYSGYRPTGNFETEFRIFLEVSGVRATTEDLPDQLIDAQRNNLVTAFPGAQEEIDRILNLAREEQPEFSEIVDLFFPTYEKYYSVDEIQELNKFYSTELMQNMVKKSRVINAELAPILTSVQQDVMMRLTDRIVASESLSVR